MNHIEQALRELVEIYEAPQPTEASSLAKFIERRINAYKAARAALSALEFKSGSEREAPPESRLNQALWALSFFASCIKSGEPWTDECQRVYDAATLPR